MARVLSDSEIQSLLREKKTLPANWESRMKPIPKEGTKFKQRQYEFTGDDEHSFRLIVRQNVLNIMDFSIILTFIDSDKQEYRLIRFNGTHPSIHTNKVEKRSGAKKYAFRNKFHIHEATERYQLAALDIDGYAVETKQYNSFDAALGLFVKSNGFVVERDQSGQMKLFGNEA
jgi:hypothetical protein